MTEHETKQRPVIPGTKRLGFDQKTWAAAAMATVFIVTFATLGGIPGLLIVMGLAGFAVSLFVLVTGRTGWTRIPTREVAAVILATAIVATAMGGSLVNALSSDKIDVPASASTDFPVEPAESPTPTPTPTPEPRATFTAEAPADPAAVALPQDLASVAAPDKSVTTATAPVVLATLPVKGKDAKTGYQRSLQFGTAWLDVDRNGCDTRNDILARDLANIVRSGPCRVLSGILDEPYTEGVISFIRGNDTSALVQIDHIVTLSNAWQTGAQHLSPAQRISLANDPLNLIAVDGLANAKKGDGDAATWLPEARSFRCEYVARQISVKATYGLWVTEAEHDAMDRVLTTCPDQPAATSAFAPDPAPVVAIEPEPVPFVAEPEPAPEPASEPAPVSTFYENCTAVRAAGAAPIYAGDAGYSRKLDRDGDGVGCE